MNKELRALTDRLRCEAVVEGERAVEECERLARTAGPEELAGVLSDPGRPLWARELAAYRLGTAKDPRAFETLVLFLNHRDPQRCATAAQALAALGDPRTARAAAALATNELRVAYAGQAVRLLTTLRAPESVPALIATLERRLVRNDPYRNVALACVAGLGVLGDRRGAPRPPGRRTAPGPWRRRLRRARPHPGPAQPPPRGTAQEGGRDRGLRPGPGREPAASRGRDRRSTGPRRAVRRTHGGPFPSHDGPFP
ncbi:magnesium or manganese-dependent protein phosphatase [Streptomyces sp. SPB78]|nr:magnesium or manganese-dependent protein phosphatase [Streptomyces sp. SPB78]